jgi:acetolactate synthase-1/2/3 large subunit
MLDTFFVNKPAQSQVVASSGSLYCLAWHMYRPKEGDRYIASSHGDMGYELPVAIGACKNTEKRTFCLVGDGSFQLNVQELATLKLLQLPVTVMVFNNGGYGAIQITQNAQFGRLYGTEFETSIEGVAKGYGLPYYKVKDPSDTTYLDHTGPVVVEFECHVQERTPKISNRPLGNGKFENASYDNMYPFLDQEVLKINSFSP